MVELMGWSKDRLPQVLSAMLREAGLPPVSGQFSYRGFEPDEPIFDEQEQAIAAFFAPYSLAEAKKDKMEKLGASRYVAEISGITINGMTIATDRTSQALITGAALKAMQDEAYVCKWKTETGFVELTAAQILAIADAVRAHVQSCFDREAELLALVEAATTLEELEAIAWSTQASS